MMRIKGLLHSAFRRTNSIKFIVMLIFLTISFLVFPSNSVSATTNSINPTGLTSFLDKTALWVGLSEEQQTIFSQTDNIFYDPTECDEQIGGGTAGMLSGKDNLEKIWNYLVSLNEPGVSNDAKVISGILGNLQQESDFNPFSSNGTYYGVYQTDRSEMINRVNSEVGNYWGQKMEGEKNDKALQIELEDMTQKNPRWKQFVKDLSKVQNKTPTSYMELFMLHLERCVYGSYSMTDPGVIQAMHDLYSGGSYQYQDGDKRAKYAEEIYKKYGNGGVSTSTGTTSTGASSSTTSTSNIISETAAKLAWPTKGEHAKNDPKPEYKQALEETGVTAGTQCSPSSLGADCGAFVGAVIYVSKYDKDFPSVGSSTQLAYMAEHPEKYEELKNWKKSDLKSGDIQAHNGHIRIVMEDGKKLAHASQCDRTGEITDYYEDAKFRTFRPIGATSTTTDECNPTEGGTGDINQAAVKLAYPDYKNREWEEQVPAFYDAFKETGLYDMSLKSNNKSIKGHGRSCSWWVATVVVYAGAAKKDFPKGPGGQIDYMASHPETFEEVTEGYNKSKAQAGDIQCVGAKGSNYKSNGHSRIVVDKGDGKLRIAEAHLNTHQPGQIHNEEYNGSIKASGKATPTYRVFRLKKNGATNLSGASSLGQTAIKLAWPKGTGRTIKQTPEYKKAIDEVGGFLKGSSDACVRAGASCDRFVGIVVRYSGVDKKFGYNLDYGKSGSRPTASNSGHKSAGHALAHPELWEDVTEGYGKDTMRDGDVHVCPGHVRMIAKADDGKMYVVEASHCEGNTSCCSTGRITSEYKGSLDYGGGKCIAFRAKNNPAYNQNCACQVNQQQSQAVEGGLTDEQAEKLVAAYKKEDGRCNCVDLSNWFIKNMLGLSAVSGNGGDIAPNLAKTHHLEHGSEPRPYAVFSTDGSMASMICSDGYKCGHTGVVVAVKGDEVTTIEAAYGNCGFTGVKKHKKSEFTSKKYGNDYVFTYTDKVLKQDELNKRIQ